MAKVIVMPKLGYTQDEGAIAAWLKNEGDSVEKGEALFDVHTDKSVVTVDATCSGTLLKIALEPEVSVPVLSPVCVIGEPGENADEILASYVVAKVADNNDDDVLTDDDEVEAAEDVKSVHTDLKLTPRARKYMAENGIDEADIADVQGTGFEGGITESDIKASPLAKKIAKAEEVDISKVNGSGVNGKVMKSDVLAAKENDMVQQSCGDAELMIEKTVPYSGVRKIIGDRLAQSKFTAPHLYFTDDVDMTNFLAFRKEINAKGEIKVAVSDLMVKAASKALVKFPGINSSLQNDSIVYYKSTNVGTAVAGDNGLIVPVIKNAQIKSLSAIAAESRDLVERAKTGHLKPDEYSGGTFSISNLGMFGIKNFTAIINPPESAILSISSVRKTPIVITDEEGNDTIEIRPMMSIQLSVDHRIIDGLLAAQFVGYFKELLENPINILM